MCGGGGDGGAAEFKRQEAERNYKTTDASRRINAVFGLDDPALYKPEDFGSGYALGESPELIEQASQNKTARAGLYDSTARDIVDYLGTELRDDYTDAQARAKAHLARRGLSGGQADIDLGQRILEIFNRGTLDVKNRADSSVAEMRGADEQARLSLLNQIQAGMDGSTAVSSAGSALKNNADQVKTAAMLQTLGNLFREADELYSTQQYVNGANQAYTGKKAGATFGDPGSYSGRVNTFQ